MEIVHTRKMGPPGGATLSTSTDYMPKKGGFGDGEQAGGGVWPTAVEQLNTSFRSTNAKLHYIRAPRSRRRLRLVRRRSSSAQMALLLVCTPSIPKLCFLGKYYIASLMDPRTAACLR